MDSTRKKRALIIRLGNYGDIVGTLSSLGLLRQNLKTDTDFYWLVLPKFEDILRGHPFLKETILFPGEYHELIPAFKERVNEGQFNYILNYHELKYFAHPNTYHCLLDLYSVGSKMVHPYNQRYDLSFYRYMFRTSTTTLRSVAEGFTECFLKNIGCLKSGERPMVLNVAQKDCSYSLPKIPPGQTVLVSPGASRKQRMLTEQDLLNFLREFSEKRTCYFLLAWNSEHEHNICEFLHGHLENSFVLPKLPITEYYSVIAQVDLVVCMDSLMMHLASAIKTPSFTFFGPSSENVRPDGFLHYSWQIPPRGRFKSNTLYAFLLNRTRDGTKEIPMTYVFDHFMKWWVNIEKYHKNGRPFPAELIGEFGKAPYPAVLRAILCLVRFFVRII